MKSIVLIVVAMFAFIGFSFSPGFINCRFDNNGNIIKTDSTIKGVEVKRSSPTFNEFTVCLPKDASEVVGKMIEKGFAAGFPLGRYYKGMEKYLLVAVTEKRTKDEIDRYAKALAEVLA